MIKQSGLDPEFFFTDIEILFLYLQRSFKLHIIFLGRHMIVLSVDNTRYIRYDIRYYIDGIIYGIKDGSRPLLGLFSDIYVNFLLIIDNILNMDYLILNMSDKRID